MKPAIPREIKIAAPLLQLCAPILQALTDYHSISKKYSGVSESESIKRN